MANTEPRICASFCAKLTLAGVIVFLHIHTVSVFLELGINILGGVEIDDCSLPFAGTYLLFVNEDYCPDAEKDFSVVVITKLVVVSCWIHLILIFIAFGCIFNPIFTHHPDDQLHGVWQERLRLLFCCTGMPSRTKLKTAETLLYDV